MGSLVFRSSARSLLLFAIGPPTGSSISITSAYLGRLSVVVKMGRVLHLPFDVDYLGHGPPRGRTAALSSIASSTCPTASLSLRLATLSTTGPVTHVSKGCATLWMGLVCVYSHGTLVCACLVAGRPCLESAVPDVETNWCTNDTWVRRV